MQRSERTRSMAAGAALWLLLAIGCKAKSEHALQGADGNPVTVGGPQAGAAAGSPAPVASSAGTQGAASDGAGGSGNGAGSNANAGSGAAGGAAATGAEHDAATPDAGSAAKPPQPDPNAWRMMGYDERNWYSNPAETTLAVDNAARLSEKWRFATSGFPVGSPVIAEGKVFAMASGATYALDLASGKELWRREDLSGSAALAYADGFVYVQNSLPPLLYKLAAADGTTVWGPVRNCQNDHACAGESSPVVVGDTLFVGQENNMLEASFDPAEAAGARGAVLALDIATGAQRWLYRTIDDAGANGENGASVWSTVAVDRASATVFATTGNNYTAAGPNANAFHAIDLGAGTRKWVTQVRTGDVWTAASSNDQLDMDFGANPILAEIGGQPVVAAGDKGGAFWVVHRDTGRLLWQRNDLAPSHSAYSGGIFINGAFDGSAFYVVSNDKASGGAVLHRLDAAREGASTWTRKLPETTWAALSLANGLLLVPNNATLHVLSAATGDELNRFDTGGTIAAGAAAIAQGRIVVKSGVIVPNDPLNSRPNNQIICYGLP